MINVNSVHYFDTNALFKYYTNQNGHLHVCELVATCKEPLIVSQLTLLECIGVLMKYFRKKQLKRKQLNAIIKRIRRDCRVGESKRPFQIVQIIPQYYNEAQGILLKYASEYAIESNDALHLAAALNHSRSVKQTTFVTSDRSLKITSKLNDINCYDPELNF